MPSRSCARLRPSRSAGACSRPALRDEARVPIISPRVEEPYLCARFGDPHRLRRRLRKVASEAGKCEVLQNVCSTADSRSYVLDVELLAGELLGCETVLAPVIGSLGDLCVERVPRPMGCHDVVQPRRGQPQ